MSQRFTSLWHHADFLRLWAGETISRIGSAVTALALPLTALIVVHATAFQISLLAAATWLPYLLMPQVIGYWVDRHKRRPLLIGADVGRALLLGLIPLLAVGKMLRIEALYGIAFLTGTLTVVFNLSYGSYFQTLVPREHLLEGNSKLAVSSSVAELGGPSLGGFLVQLLSAPVAILSDALSFLGSAVGLLSIRQAEPAPVLPPATMTRGQQIREGIRVTFTNPYLRAMAGAAALYNLFDQMFSALWVVYGIQVLHLTPAWLGLSLGVGSIGGLVGSLLAAPFFRRLGFGHAFVVAAVIECAPLVLLGLVGGAMAWIIGVLMFAFFWNGVGLAISNIAVPSLRQAIVPPRLTGRVIASYSTLTLGVVPLGALLAGIIQTRIGVRATVLWGGVGTLASVLWLLLSPIGQVRTLAEAPVIGTQEEADYKAKSIS